MHESIPFSVLLYSNSSGQCFMAENLNEAVVANRRKRLQKWIDERCEGTQSGFVEKTGINQGELSSLLKKKSFGEKKARALEGLAGMPPGWLDVIDSKTTGNIIQDVANWSAGASMLPINATLTPEEEECIAAFRCLPDERKLWYRASIVNERKYPLPTVAPPKTGTRK